jgi:tetratricopeptide (TPR) repeat protein
LLGPIQLLDRDGVDRLDGTCGEKTKGLLALLAIYGDRPCSRAMLQDKLWSDRGHKQGRDSLKQSLVQLRKAFGDDAASILRSDGGPVMLDRRRMSIDYFERNETASDDPIAPTREFLEGIDIGDDQFNLWLSEIRARLAGQGDGAGPTAAMDPAGDTGQSLSIALFPVKTADGDFRADVLAGMLLDRIATGLRHYEIFRLHDFRDIDGIGDRSSDLVLNCQTVSIGDSVSVSFGLRRVSDQLLVWSGRVALEPGKMAAERLSEITAHLVDQIIDRALKVDFGLNTAHHAAARKVIGGIDRLLRRSDPTLERATADLQEACELYPTSTYYAWQAYAVAHHLEAGSGTVAELRSKADALAAKAIEADPHNPLTRSLLTHVYGFVIQDFDRAASLIAPLRADEPDLPFYHYTKGFLHVYTGDYDKARAAGDRAMRLGRSSPYSYLFSCLSLAATSLSGDYAGAIRLGQRSLAEQFPGTFPFPPTLRYLAASAAIAGEEQLAADVYGSIVRRFQDFSVEKLDEPGAPYPSEAVRRLMRTGLTKAGTSFRERGSLGAARRLDRSGDHDLRT